MDSEQAQAHGQDGYRTHEKELQEVLMLLGIRSANMYQTMSGDFRFNGRLPADKVPNFVEIVRGLVQGHEIDMGNPHGL